jgi:hypothetical protein
MLLFSIPHPPDMSESSGSYHPLEIPISSARCSRILCLQIRRRARCWPAAFNQYLVQKQLIMTSLQVTLALTNHDFKQKWGAHYTRSLLSAHRMQQCHNYKVRPAPPKQSEPLRPLKQFFRRTPRFNSTAAPCSSARSSFIFISTLDVCPFPVPRHIVLRSICDAADAAFCTLPAPKGRVIPARGQPSHQQSFNGASMPAPAAAGAAASAPPAVDMSLFMDRYGGCFAPHVSLNACALWWRWRWWWRRWFGLGWESLIGLRQRIHLSAVPCQAG